MTFKSRSEGGLPDEKPLAEFAARNRDVLRRARLERAAAEAIQELMRAGVDVLLLKGAALAKTLYAPNHDRSYFDVDLLVEAHLLPAAEDVLASLGYRNVTRDRGIDHVTGALHAENWTKLDAFGNVSIDLHWKLAGCGAAPQIVWAALRSDAQNIKVADTSVLTLSTVGLAMHTALHLAQHGLLDAKAASDLRLALSRWPISTWGESAALAERVDALDAFSAGLRLTPEGAITAESLKLASGGGTLWDLQHRGERPRGTFHVAAFAHATTSRQRLAVLRRALLPSPDWIRWEMRWANRGPAHLGLAYLAHLARAPWWAARALSFARTRGASRPKADRS